MWKCTMPRWCGTTSCARRRASSSRASIFICSTGAAGIGSVCARCRRQRLLRLSTCAATYAALGSFIDSSGYCLFIAFPILDFAEGWAGMVDTVAGVMGLDISSDDVVPMGKEILKMERLFNERAGFTAADDRPPEFMRYEALPPHNVTWTVTDEELDGVFGWVHDEEPVADAA